MPLRIIIDQSHNEFLTATNTTIFQALLTEMEIIIFSLIDSPITFEKIKDEDILFLGCPSTLFQETEINALKQFVDIGKFLILISGSGGDYANNTNLSEITRRFEFEFNPDYVEDEKHYFNFSRIPVIQKFKKNPLVKQIKRLLYSGCSISILDPTTIAILSTSLDSIPKDSPIMVFSENRLVFGIGGYSFFMDDPVYGIKALDNFRFVYNMFDYIKSNFGKSKEKEVKTKVPVKPEQLSFNNAKKQFFKLISLNIQKMNKLSDDIDRFWAECSALIRNQDYNQADNCISSNYQQILQTIESAAREIGNFFSEYNTMFSEFKQAIQENFNQWYETEGEVRAKLDMIRNNLSNSLKKEQVNP
jgi:hypothetical protein